MRRKQLIREIKKSFACQRCNECCRQPGYVFLTGKDIRRMAAFHRQSEQAFISRFCRWDAGHWVLKMREDGACIFLSQEGCSIHEAKPQQCREFPVKWREEESFDYCEGIRRLKEAISKKSSSRTALEKPAKPEEKR